MSGAESWPRSLRGRSWSDIAGLSWLDLACRIRRSVHLGSPWPVPFYQTGGGECRDREGDAPRRSSNRVLAGTTLLRRTQRATAAWGQGGNPLPPEGAPMRNRGKQRTSALWNRPLRTHRSLCTPSGLVRGHTARCPRLDTPSFRHLSTAEASGGQRGVAPLYPPPGCPLTRLFDCTRSRFPRLHPI